MTSETMVVAKQDYHAECEQELNIHKNEKLLLLDGTQHWWQVMNAEGQSGLVPSHHVKKVKTGIFSSLRRPWGRRKSKDHGVMATSGESLNITSAVGGGKLSTTGGAASSPDRQYQRKIHNNNKSTDETSSSFPHSMDSHSSLSNAKVNVDHPSLGGAAAAAASVPTNASNQFVPSPAAAAYQPPLHQRSGSNDNDLAGMDIALLPSDATAAVAADGVLISTSTHQGMMLPMSAASASSPNAEFCVAKFPYIPHHSDELTLQQGDEIFVLQKCSDSWWYGRLINVTEPANSNNVLIEGWFPSNYTEPLLYPSHVQAMSPPSSSSVPPLSSSSTAAAAAAFSMASSMGQTQQPSQLELATYDHENQSQSGSSSIRGRLAVVRTLYAFSRNQMSELSFEAGEILEIIDKPVDDPQWWLARNSRREEGLVPVNYIAIVQPDGTAVTVAQNNGVHMLAMNGEQLRLSYNVQGKYADRVWYWGSISRMDCEFMLSQMSAPGHYVVRDSETHPGSLTVTMFTGTRCRNFKVVLADGRYKIGERHFEKMENLLDYYSRNPIYKSEEETHCLLTPFIHPGSTALMR